MDANHDSRILVLARLQADNELLNSLYDALTLFYRFGLLSVGAEDW